MLDFCPLWHSIFTKSYEPVYTIAIFEIADVIFDTPPTYKLKDLSGEAIEGVAYGEELKLVTKPEGGN